MGGPIGKEEIINLGYELAISEIKYEMKSNIIPLGKVQLGTYYHRALLFKVRIFFIFYYYVMYLIYFILLYKGTC
jgi:hypothetical protein